MPKVNFLIIKIRTKKLINLNFQLCDNIWLHFFFQMRKYLMKFFVNCKIFCDFCNKYAKNIMNVFAGCKNYFKVFNLCGKIVAIFYLVCENVVSFFKNIEIGLTF